jgi:hypothetical protein
LRVVAIRIERTVGSTFVTGTLVTSFPGLRRGDLAGNEFADSFEQFLRSLRPLSFSNVRRSRGRRASSVGQPAIV